jgi:1-acyl-sn-glycerol-3-phosphate acyltransferase
MWSAVCVAGVVCGLVRDWARSGLSWRDYLVVRVAYVYSRLLHRWSITRRCSLPGRGPAIVVCNHTCSPDAAFVVAAWQRPVSFLVAGEHFDLHPVGHAILKYLHCVPVVRSGPDPRALRRAMTRLAMGDVVCLFPEGNLSGVALGRVRVCKPGAAFLALTSRLPVYPVHIAGGPCTDDIVKAWLLPARQPVHVVLGKPIDLTPYYHRPRTRQLFEEVTCLLMEKVRELGAKNREADRVIRSSG